MTIAAAIRQMLDAGLTIEQALIAAEAFEANRPRSKGAERTARWRAKASQSVTVTESDGCDGCDANETFLPHQESPLTPKEPTPSNPSTQQEKTLRVQKKASRLPADWQLPDEWRQDAITAGLDPSRINLEADKIRDWSRSSKNGAKLDWRATWRNWCREAAGRSPPARGSPAFKAPSQSDVFRLIAERAANGQDGDDRGRIRPALSDLRTG